MDIREKIRGFYLGFRSGESACGNLPEETGHLSMLLCGTYPLIEAHDDEKVLMDLSCNYIRQWAKGPPRKGYEACYSIAISPSQETRFAPVASMEICPVIRCLPVGIYHYDNLLDTISIAKESCLLTHVHPTVQVSSVAGALMALLSMGDVPCGMWLNEIQAPLGGVGILPGLSSVGMQDNLMVHLTMAAANAGGMDDTDCYLGDGWMAHELLSWALFCIMSSPRDFDKALALASQTPNPPAVSCLAGALLGGLLGEEAVGGDDIVGKELVLSAADDLANAILQKSVEKKTPS